MYRIYDILQNAYFHICKKGTFHTMRGIIGVMFLSVKRYISSACFYVKYTGIAPLLYQNSFLYFLYFFLRNY